MESAMTDLRLAPYAALVLRLALGAMFFAHAVVLKFAVYTLPGTAKFFEGALGLPGWTAYAVFATETLGSILLILGVQTRWVALAVTPILIGATWAHSANGWMF